MKHLLLTTIAAVVLVGRGKSITIHELPRGNPEELGMSSEGLKKYNHTTLFLVIVDHSKIYFPKGFRNHA